MVKKNSGGSKILFELMANHSRFGIRISNFESSFIIVKSIGFDRFISVFLYIYFFLAWNSVCFLKNISQFGYHSYKFEFSVLNLGNIFYFFFVSNHFSKKKKKNDLKIGKKFGKPSMLCVSVLTIGGSFVFFSHFFHYSHFIGRDFNRINHHWSIRLMNYWWWLLLLKKMIKKMKIH